ncbi:prepilin-type N-terminal cleavage/methylation domain-containing protein [Anabaena sp. 4-3]|uniref:prepilin-type N-terminal cleavage/methylation domain-containing protein n=1 Tax=Anabaena sp. 4-3 TaxID=1811979 RepID=UPI0009EEA445|nr:prepilin-type N-terminal cleavage/methylation domain-containing protein [Anabaena sp. 4-3]
MNQRSFQLLQTCKDNHKSQKQPLASRLAVKLVKPEAGFSLIEIIVVVLMIGVLAAILAPNWFRFLSQQRLNKANDAILAAIQEAQRQAKRQKRDYSVSFKVDDNNIPLVALYEGTTPTNWRKLGEDLEIESGKLQLSTNLTSKNTAGAAVSAISSTPQTITFDYMGTLPGANFGTAPSGSDETPGIKVVVSANNTKRCVILKTILGATLTKKDGDCS